MPELNDLIGTAQAARILGKQPRTVQRMVAAGVLTPVTTLPGKTGAHLFSREDVERVKAEREAAA